MGRTLEESVEAVRGLLTNRDVVPDELVKDLSAVLDAAEKQIDAESIDFGSF